VPFGECKEEWLEETLQRSEVEGGGSSQRAGKPSQGQEMVSIKEGEEPSESRIEPPKQKSQSFKSYITSEVET
jgi:hypothetical protein